MKKRIVVLLSLCLLLGCTSPVSAANAPPGGGSISELFQQMQQQHQQQTQSISKLTQRVAELQRESSTVVGYLRQAESLRTQAGDSKTATRMPPAMKALMDEKQLAYDRTGNDDMHTAIQWEVAIQSLEAYYGKLGEETQRAVAQMQNSMGDYNAALQGAQASLSSIARGQSLFSTTGGGSMDAPLMATSLLAGVVLGMLAMWGIQRGKQRRDGRP